MKLSSKTLHRAAALTLSAMFATSAGMAGAAEPAQEAGAKPDPRVDAMSCTTARGEQATYIPLTAAEFEQTGAMFAAASYFGPGIPIIIYDAETLAKAPDDALTFIMEHECAHHSIGHTLTPPMLMTRDIVALGEMQADCEAAIVSRDVYHMDAARLRAAFDFTKTVLPAEAAPMIDARYAAAMVCFEQAPPGATLKPAPTQ